MFTGLIEELGQVTSLDIQSTENTNDPNNKGGCVLTINTPEHKVLQGVQQGDSISVNGVCLTVIAFHAPETQPESKEAVSEWSFKVGVAPETLRRTCLGDLKVGDRVNLERSVTANGRMGGHFVQGHVDGTATVASRTIDGDSLRLTFDASPALLRYIVEKGYVAIDGISLTVCAPVTDSSFAVMLIAYTQTRVNLPNKKIGDRVNIEVDILGKYAEKFCAPRDKSSPHSDCSEHSNHHMHCCWTVRHGWCSCRWRSRRKALCVGLVAAGIWVLASAFFEHKSHHHHRDVSPNN